jgi:hypothetical protein
MTQDEIIEMAKQAGYDEHNAKFDTRIQSLAKLVAQHEREACAKIVDEFCYGSTKILVEKAIRARGQA